METASPNPVHKQNGTDLYCGIPTNGKLRSCTGAGFDDDDDFGPETDVDMVDDAILLRNTIPKIRSGAIPFMTGKENFDDDLERQRQQLSDFDDPADIDRSRDTPTPPAHEVAGNADADNLTESGDGEDSEEDDWNYIPGSGENKKEEKPEQVEDDDDMSSQLNPNAAEFVPVSPKRSHFGDSDPEVSSSSLCFEKSLDNAPIPTQLEFTSEISKRPSQLDFINGQTEDHQIGNELNDSAIPHQTLEDTNILSTKAEFGDSTCFETSMNSSNPFSTEDLPLDGQQSAFDPLSFENLKSFDVKELSNLTSSGLAENLEAVSNLDPVRTVKEFKTFAECVSEPKHSTKTPDLDDNLFPETPRSTIVEAPVSPSSDVSPIPHREDIESPDDYLANVPKSPELISPSEEQHDVFTGQEPTSSSGFESESGAEETETNILVETNFNDNDGFVLETKRLSPPIQTLSFKPIETFSDKNPFGLLENPSPLYVDKIESSQNVGSGEISTDETSSQLLTEAPSSHLPPASEAQDVLLSLCSSTTEDTPNENEESKIRLDEQESEQEIKTKDATFGLDSKQEAIDVITSAFNENLLDDIIPSGKDFGNEQHLFNPFEEDCKQSVEFEAKESDFQFESTDSVPLHFNRCSDVEQISSDVVNTELKDVDFEVDEKKELESFDTSKEISNLHDNEKESDTAVENVAKEDIISHETIHLLESPITLETKDPKGELKLDLPDNSDPSKDASVSPLPKKDQSPLSPTAPAFVPTHVPVSEPLCKQVILEKKFTEPDSESDVNEEGICSDFVEPVQIESTPQDLLSQLDVGLSEPEIHDVREGINEIIKEAADRIVSEDILELNVQSSEVERVSEALVPEAVSEVLQNELIVQSTEPVPATLLTEKQPLSPDHSEIVQESAVSVEKEQTSAEVEPTTEALDVKEVPSATGTPPPTPAPGLVEEQHEESKEGLLAAAVAVASAGVVAVAAADVKKSTATAAKKTPVASKKLVDTTAKTTGKPAQTTTKPAAKPTAAKPEAKKPAATTVAAKPSLKPTAASKPTTATSKPASKPSTPTLKPSPSPSKPGTKSASPAVKSTITKAATPLSSPTTATSKPSTPTSLRPTSANKPASPTKSVAATKTTVSAPKPPATKAPPTRITEKKPLTNGDVSKPAAIKKPDVAAAKKTTTSTVTSAKPSAITRPPSASTKPSVTSKAPTTTVGKAPASKPLSAAPKPKSAAPVSATAKPATKPVTSSTVPKSRPPSATTTTKLIDKTGKDNVNKQISSEKTGSKTLASKTTTKKTDIKTAGSGKPKPVSKPGGEVKKEESNKGPMQEGLITTTNGYGDILENGIKKDESHQDVMVEAIN